MKPIVRAAVRKAPISLTWNEPIWCVATTVDGTTLCIHEAPTWTAAMLDAHSLTRQWARALA